MPKIAISYRRADSIAVTGRIYDRLAHQFGAQSVFMDLDGIPPGVDFRRHVDEVLRESDALIVVIGKNWVGATEQGLPRILEPADPVRIEVETALALKTMLIPVLVDDATMPNAAQLPPSLAEFSYRNALKVDAGKDFHVHVGRLLNALNRAFGLPGGEMAQPGTKSGSPAGRLTAGMIAAYLAAPVVLLLFAHYLFVIKFDLHTMYLRLAVVAIPFLAGFLFWRERRSLAATLVVAFTVAIAATAGMHLVVWAIESSPLMPSDRAEWQTAFEVFASIALALTGGYLAARMLRSMQGSRPG